MRIHSLRVRVALAAAAGVFLAVAALAIAAPRIVAHELRASQDRGLRARAGDIARLSASAPALLTAPGALDAPYGGQDLLVEVLDTRQRVVARSSALGGRLVDAQPLVGGRSPTPVLDSVISRCRATRCGCSWRRYPPGRDRQPEEP